MATDVFMKIDGIEGESTDSKHKDEIEVRSFSWAETNAATGASGGGRGAGKVSMSDLVITKDVDKSTPKLALACATGEHIPEATLTVRRAGGEQQEYLTIKLADCFVTSYQMSGSDGGVVPSESFSLNYTKIEWEYKPQNPDGTLAAAQVTGFDIGLGTKK